MGSDSDREAARWWFVGIHRPQWFGAAAVAASRQGKVRCVREKKRTSEGGDFVGLRGGSSGRGLRRGFDRRWCGGASRVVVAEKKTRSFGGSFLVAFSGEDSGFPARFK